MAARYVLALDQGTTGSTAMLFDRGGRVVGRGYREIPQHYPRPGWVEHDPTDLWRQSLAAIAEAKAEVGASDGDIAALGITNQRETTVVWDARTGEPVHNAIVWQCRRSAALCDALVAAGHRDVIRARTGLIVDAYFSGTKIQWLLQGNPDVRRRAEAGELHFGTVDSWLIWNLTGGRVHATDVTNAARTMLFNIYERAWDEEMLRILGVPASMLPRVVDSAGVVAETVPCALDGVPVLGGGIPIAGVAGDQHAALFGQACYAPGMVKVTYGTGSFLLMQTGERAYSSTSGLLTTPAWSVGGTTSFVLEGAVFIAGAAVQWLRDELRIIERASDTETLARSVPDTGGVYFVPAFVGLGAPYWDMYARGLLIGLTRGTGRAHIARATLESIAYQVRDVIDAMARDAALPLGELRVDGGAAANDFLCQFQADVLGTPVVRPRITETTALGAAYLAGLAVGVWPSTEAIGALWQVDRRFEPALAALERERLYAGWQKAVARARDWDHDA